ncbi:MAG: hypothetical protein ACYS19_15995 [Planctomycetota bacterium]
MAQKISEICEICGGILLNTLCSTIVENPLQINLFMQNKAKVNIGKMNISIARTKDYDKNNEQSTTKVIQNKAKVNIGKMNISIVTIKDYGKNNEQPATNVIFKTNPNKANLKRNDGFSAYYTRDCHGTHRINRAVEGRGSEKGPAEKVNASAQKSFREENGIDGQAVLGYPVGVEL